MTKSIYDELPFVETKEPFVYQGNTFWKKLARLHEQKKLIPVITPDGNKAYVPSPGNEVVDAVIETLKKENLMPEANPHTEALLAERHTTHGNFRNTADYIQSLKSVMYRAERERRERGQPQLTAVQREALEMVFHKAGRILSGDASFEDHWSDIAGYAKLPVTPL